MVVALVLLALASACSRSAALPACVFMRCQPQACSAVMRSTKWDHMTSKVLAMVNNEINTNGRTLCRHPAGHTMW